MKHNFFHIKTPEKLDCESKMKLIFFMSFPSHSHNIGMITLIHFLNNCLLEKEKREKKSESWKLSRIWKSVISILFPISNENRKMNRDMKNNVNSMVGNFGMVFGQKKRVGRSDFEPQNSTINWSLNYLSPKWIFNIEKCDNSNPPEAQRKEPPVQSVFSLNTN